MTQTLIVNGRAEVTDLGSNKRSRGITEKSIYVKKMFIEAEGAAMQMNAWRRSLIQKHLMFSFFPV